MRDDKIIIISCYHFLCTILFLCKSESGNFISFWARHDLFCLISSKRNLILSHLIKKESDSVSFHKIRIQFCLISWKMNLILSHFIEKKSDFISSHRKKISSHSDSDSEQNQIRTENSDSCSQSNQSHILSADIIIDHLQELDKSIQIDQKVISIKRINYDSNILF